MINFTANVNDTCTISDILFKSIDNQTYDI
jgi:hypothetical protein